MKQETSESNLKFEKEELKELTGGIANQDCLSIGKSDKKRPQSRPSADEVYNPIELPEVP